MKRKVLFCIFTLNIFAFIQALEKIEPVLVIHGGAGTISDERIPQKVRGMKIAVDRGYKILHSGGSALDAVEAALMAMEDDEAFNAGYGSVLNLDGEVEMEASIQRGSDLAVGSVALIKHFKNPISIAKRVMEKTPHSILGGEGAKKFAIRQGFEVVDPQSMISQAALDGINKFLQDPNNAPAQEIRSNSSSSSKIEPDLGTVGAIAIDADGRIAAGTSSGGTNGKYVGRFGATPVIGGGTYADDFVGGVSCTGHGESILKTALAHTITTHMENGHSAQNATELGLNYLTNRLKKTAGAISLSKNGDVGVYFTSKQMAWSFIKENKIYWGVRKNEMEEDVYYPF